MPIAEIQNRKIEYEIYGPDASVTTRPLVLLNGMGGSSRGWLPLQVPETSKSRRTILVNHRGVMGSEDPGGPFTTADLADDVALLLDALKIETADVLGSFMGGMAAQELALRHPSRVDHLALLGTYARPDAKRRLILEDWANLARAEISQKILLRTRMTWTLEDRTLEQTELIEGMLRFFEEEGSPVSHDLFARQCDACLGHDTLDRLAEIRQPTLVICGRRDRLTPPTLHRELADHLPNARLVVLQYGAHLVMMESAERFNQVVLQFLDSRDH
ncbi:MAG: alpha/beta fold hydrolase [Deltaproteobacteria bacterium]|nr:alpha/beta fold hydrolase [Deltaproteobacteria bacterium]